MAAFRTALEHGKAIDEWDVLPNEKRFRDDPIASLGLSKKPLFYQSNRLCSFAFPKT